MLVLRISPVFDGQEQFGFHLANKLITPGHGPIPRARSCLIGPFKRRSPSDGSLALVSKQGLPSFALQANTTQGFVAAQMLLRARPLLPMNSLALEGDAVRVEEARVSLLREDGLTSRRDQARMWRNSATSCCRPAISTPTAVWRIRRCAMPSCPPAAPAPPLVGGGALEKRGKNSPSPVIPPDELHLR